MTLVVQDNTGGVTGANSYGSVVDFKAYHDVRGNTYTNTDALIEKALIKATSYVDTRWFFRGRRLNSPSQQTTQWPRMSAMDNDQRLITGIPSALKEAVFEYALRAMTITLRPDPVRDSSGQAVLSKSSSVGPISKSVTYSGPGVTKLESYPEADARVKAAGLINSQGDVVRG